MQVCQPHPENAAPVGLVAGWGRYPLVIAQVLRQQHRPVVCLAVKDHADPALRELSDVYAEFGLGKLGASLRYFRRNGVTTATMAGKIHKVLLFRTSFLWKHFPDWRCLRTFYPHFISHRRDRKDDTLLGAIVDAFAEEGITMVPATDFLPEVLVKPGCLTRRQPSRIEAIDIAFGWTIAKEMGRLDIGQSVAVKGQAALAVEAVEGTDLCIQRAGQLCPSGGFTVVKVAKPQQDMRFDVPTVGLVTLESMRKSGARVLAIEANRTILIDEPQVIEFANRHGMVIIALENGQTPDGGP
jgi:DUF1009 family protein